MFTFDTIYFHHVVAAPCFCVDIASSGNPNGIPSQSPGLRGTGHLGKTSTEGHNPNGVAANITRAPDENGIAATALRLGNLFHDDPR